MAVTNNSRTPGNQTLGASANSTSVSMTGTIAAGLSNGIVVVVVQTDAGASVSSVAWDTAGVNESLSQLGVVAGTGATPSGAARAEIWYRVAPTSGASKNLQVNWSGTHHGQVSFAVYEGVDQSSPWLGAAQTASGDAGTQPALTITSLNNGFVVSSVVWDLNGGWSNPPSKGASQNYIGAGVNGTSNSSIAGGGSDQAASGSTVAVSWAEPGNPDPASPWGIVGGCLQPVTAPGSTLSVSSIGEPVVGGSTF